MEVEVVTHNFERGPLKVHPVIFGLIWFSGLRGDDLYKIFHHNMPNFHKSAEKRKSQKKTEYMSFAS
jgi:hypothetical protein